MNSPSNRLIAHNGAPRAGLPRADVAHEYLRTELLEGVLGPGDKLSVVAITKHLDCSRVPVMEALKRLEKDGFIEIIPQVGCQVVTPSVGDVADFFSLFAAVEATVTGLAADRRTPEDIRKFKSLCQHIDEESASAGGPQDNDPTYRHLNLMFHSAIHEMANSPVSTNYAAGLWDRSDFYIKLVHGSLYFSSAVKRAHRMIRKAIISGDCDVAKTAITAHLNSVGNGVVKALQKL